MNKFIAAILLAFSAVVSAMPIGYIGDLGERGKASLLLHNTPCANEKALSFVPPDQRASLFHGEYTFSHGKQIVACWMTDGRGVYIIDEEGDTGAFPVTAIKPLTRI